ncbi:hypothetical protein DMUE_6107 [Dictyocoela muelleri]|nr:hypothetical protein DMUE_6107 [Dictyocoela muelleri]
MININLEKILLIRSQSHMSIEFLKDRGILRRIMYCDGCNGLMKKVIYKRNIDGLAWRCYRKSCSEFLKYVSIRKNSIFSDFKIPLGDCILICYWFFCGFLKKDLIKEFGIKKDVISKMYGKLRERISRDLEENPIRLGGEGVICQIDESMFHYKQKYHHGRVSQENRWVFGIADTTLKPARYFVKVVPNRRKETLLSIINNVCRPGTIIWSDEWRSYDSIHENFLHERVNHSINFINPINNANTQTIESLWNRLKLKLKYMMGVGNLSLQSYLNEWMWKDNRANDDFLNLLNLLI